MCERNTYYFQNLWREPVHEIWPVRLFAVMPSQWVRLWLEKGKQTTHALSSSQKQLKPKTLRLCDGAGTLPYLSSNSGIHQV